ncbi:acyltransferase LovD [Diplogelasinospora grovesii]|uniref:Acyltransferase LovD n=1 Tax=Diplogelasinospora grovesii TaxID=303347 RepID=A0AAN6N1J7_9PEZI|nr:acyltransferase LovD [Diplogelasinospora grovesii]
MAATFKLDNILKEYVAQDADTKDKLLGAAFVVVSKDGVIYQGSAGRTDLPVTSPKFTPHSFTWVASLTKLVTITCIMRFVEEGLIRLDDDVRPLVPELARMQILRGFDETTGKPILEDNTKRITLRHLLTHTVGLGYDIADPDLNRWSKAVGRTATNLSYTLEGWNTPLKFAPGEGWYYGSAIDWAGQVLEKITPLPLEHILAHKICRPLGMRNTTFHPREVERNEGCTAIACSYRDKETGALSTGPAPVPVHPPVDSGGAGLWTTAADYARVLQALLQASAGGDIPGGVVSGAAAVEMFRPQLDERQHAMLKHLTDMFRDGMVPEFPPGTPLNHGLGGVINTEDVPGKRRKGSMMWAGMCNSHWWIDRETGIGATLIVNVLPQPDLVVNRLYNDLELAVYGDLVPEWENFKENGDIVARSQPRRRTEEFMARQD